MANELIKALDKYLNVPQELRKLMPVEDIEGVEKLASLALEYPLKQESHLSLVSA